MADIKINGLAELQKFLDQLPAKMEANVMRGALMSGQREYSECVIEAYTV